MFSSRFFKSRTFTARFWEEALPAAPTFNPIWATDTDQTDQPLVPTKV